MSTVAAGHQRHRARSFFLGATACPRCVSGRGTQRAAAPWAQQPRRWSLLLALSPAGALGQVTSPLSWRLAWQARTCVAPPAARDFFHHIAAGQRPTWARSQPRSLLPYVRCRASFIAHVAVVIPLPHLAAAAAPPARPRPRAAAAPRAARLRCAPARAARARAKGAGRRAALLRRRAAAARGAVCVHAALPVRCGLATHGARLLEPRVPHVDRRGGACRQRSFRYVGIIFATDEPRRCERYPVTLALGWSVSVLWARAST